MDITFESDRQRRFFNDQRALQQRHGAKMARRISQRLDDLAAAETLEIVCALPGRCHELHGDLCGVLSLDLDHPYRLLIEPTEPAPRLPDGGLDQAEDPHE